MASLATPRSIRHDIEESHVATRRRKDGLAIGPGFFAAAAAVDEINLEYGTEGEETRRRRRATPTPAEAPTGPGPPSGSRQQTIAPVVIPGGDGRRSWARGGRCEDKDKGDILGLFPRAV